MNLLSLQQEIGRLLSDPNNQRWAPDILTTRINQAQTIVQGYTNAVKTLEQLALVASQREYSLNANTMDIIRVNLTDSVGNTFKLQGISREALDIEYPNWQNYSAGKPMFYYYDATNQKIGMVPSPDGNQAAVTTPVSVYEIRQPSDLANLTDIPFDSNNQMIPYHLAIVHWVVAQCWMDDGTPESLAKSKFHRTGNLQSPGQFELQIQRILAKFDTPIDIPSRIMFKLQGGRLGTLGQSKAAPLGGL